MLMWNETRLPTGDVQWEICEHGEIVAYAGSANAGQRVGRGALATGMRHFFVAPGGRCIWFDSEASLRAFVDQMFATTLSVEDRHQAALVGVMWAHEIAYRFDRGAQALPLPTTFPGRSEEIPNLLLDKTDDHVRNSAPIIEAAARASWLELRLRPLADRPFPVLQ